MSLSPVKQGYEDSSVNSEKYKAWSLTSKGKRMERGTEGLRQKGRISGMKRGEKGGRRNKKICRWICRDFPSHQKHIFFMNLPHIPLMTSALYINNTHTAFPHRTLCSFLATSLSSSFPYCSAQMILPLSISPNHFPFNLWQ